MSEHQSVVYLRRVLGAIRRIKKYIGDKTKEDFKKDDLLIDGVLMQLQVIGEAVNKLPKEFTALEPKIPWKRIIGLRHFIAHEYAFIEADRIWLVIDRDLEPLQLAILRLKRNITK